MANSEESVPIVTNESGVVLERDKSLRYHINARSANRPRSSLSHDIVLERVSDSGKIDRAKKFEI